MNQVMILGPKQTDRHGLHIMRSFLLLCKERLEMKINMKLEMSRISPEIFTHSGITQHGYALDVTAITLFTYEYMRFPAQTLKFDNFLQFRLIPQEGDVRDASERERIYHHLLSVRPTVTHEPSPIIPLTVLCRINHGLWGIKGIGNMSYLRETKRHGVFKVLPKIVREVANVIEAVPNSIIEKFRGTSALKQPGYHN